MNVILLETVMEPADPDDALRVAAKSNLLKTTPDPTCPIAVPPLESKIDAAACARYA